MLDCAANIDDMSAQLSMPGGAPSADILVSCSSLAPSQPLTNAAVHLAHPQAQVLSPCHRGDASQCMYLGTNLCLIHLITATGLDEHDPGVPQPVACRIHEGRLSIVHIPSARPGAHDAAAARKLVSLRPLQHPPGTLVASRAFKWGSACQRTQPVANGQHTMTPQRA